VTLLCQWGKLLCLLVRLYLRQLQGLRFLLSIKSGRESLGQDRDADIVSYVNQNLARAGQRSSRMTACRSPIWDHNRLPHLDNSLQSNITSSRVFMAVSCRTLG
jgi:hypothetical protein